MIFYYLLILTLPFYHHAWLNREIGSLSTVKVLGAICLVFSIFYVVRKGVVPNLLETRVAKLYLLLSAIALISAFRSATEEIWVSYAAMQIYVSLLILFVVTRCLLTKPFQVRRALLVSFGAMALASLYVLREYQLAGNLFVGYRPGYVVGDPNYFTLNVLLFSPIAWYWFRGEKVFAFKWAVFGSLLVGLLAAVLAASRGGLIGALAIVLFLTIRSRSKFRAVVAAGCLLLPPLLLMPNSPLKRMLEPGSGDQIGVETRMEAWKAGLRMMQAHPFQGVGLGHFGIELGQYSGDQGFKQMAHNTYLELGAELGILALLLFFWLLWETYRILEVVRRRAYRLEEEFLYRVALGMQAGLVGYAAASFFLSAQYHKVFWFFVFVAITLHSLTRHGLVQETVNAPAVEEVAA